jgi:hypothetical protein
MDRRFINSHPFTTSTDQQEENDGAPENGSESPPSSIFNDVVFGGSRNDWEMIVSEAEGKDWEMIVALETT